MCRLAVCPVLSRRILLPSLLLALLLLLASGSARALTGTVPLVLSWSSAESDRSYSVAWGDYDGDGDLDLAVGNEGQPNRLYRNDGGTLTASAVWSSTEADYTYSLAWGDYDGDGDLDLAAGSGGPRLYRNDGGTLTASAVWSSPEASPIYSVAWGDYDGDGDLDLAAGPRLYRNDGGTLTSRAVWSSTGTTLSVAWGDYDNDGDLDLAAGLQLYRNDGGTLTSRAVWSSTDETPYSVAWGDYDGDGDLDLAAGASGPKLYRNDGGTLTASAVWWSPKVDFTYSVAWGDYDGDGDLDLAAGNFQQSAELYRNDGGTLTASVVWSSARGDETHSVAWGDYDGDGDLDFAAGNDGQPNRLYRNDGGTLIASAVWSSPEADNTNSVAWGDYDGDGDLDLAVGTGYWSQPTQLYRNDGGTLTADAVWSSTEAGTTFSVAWGDYDGDGDLDLAAGNGERNRLYRNDGGTLTASAVWSSTETDPTPSVAWGDYDSDGDLDLAAGNRGPNQLYRNDGGTLTASSVWSSTEADTTYSVAWGDYDGDGDLDLAVGNGGTVGNPGQPNRLYRNDGGTLTASAVWSSTEADNTYSVAWGDYDGDGDLDLAVGNYGRPNRLYRNDGGALTASAVWSSTEANNTHSVAWGDYDGDGDLDLAVGNDGQPNRMYRNDGGTLTASAVWSSTEADYTYSVAWGDYDGDGDLDLTAGNYYGQRNRLYANTRNAVGSSGLPGSGLPAVQLARATPPYNADLYSAPNIWPSIGSSIPISYTLSQPDGQPVAYVRAYYSPDGGGRWLRAIAASGTITTSLATSSTGINYVYKWDVFASGFFGKSDNVVFRMEAIPDLRAAKNSVPGPSIYGRNASDTFPFRVRGTQVRVLRDDAPTSEALVYRQSDGQSSGGQPMADLAGQPFRTDLQGYLQGRGQIAVGDHLLALAPITSSIHYEGALSFDGADDSAFVDPLHSAPTASATVAFWLRTDASHPQGTLFSYATPTGQQELLVANPGNLVINRGSSSSGSTGVSVADGRWHHVAVTWGDSNDQMELYKDGERVAEGKLSALPLAPDGRLTVGGFTGQLDQLRIWRAVLDQATIQEMAFQPLTGNEDDLVLSWPLDDPKDTLARDQSSSENHGTNSGATWTGQPLGGYTVYATNGEPAPTGLNTYEVTHSGVQTITVSAALPLVLFDLDVSLEWDAHNDPTYLQQLAFDLRKASAYLYDFTDGQVALGKVTVHQNGDNWLSSQVVVYASNRLRPLAAQGGSVITTTHDLQRPDVTYEPGQVHMGAVWNRYGDPAQLPGLDWPLALAHELSHYLLFQEDSYLGLNDKGLLIPVGTCAGSAMGDMYDPNNTEFIADPEFWRSEAGCGRTLANHYLGRTEWATNRLWYQWLVTPKTANPGPSLMPFDLTTVTIQPPSTPTAALADPTFYIDYQENDDGEKPVSSSASRAFLQPGSSGAYNYVIDLGSPLGGQNRLLARGAQPGDRLCVFDPPHQQYGCEVIALGDERLTLTRDVAWTPAIQLSPRTAQTITIQVSGLPPGLPLRARLYPELGAGAAPISMIGATGSYTGTFNLTSPAFAGHVQVWVDEPDLPGHSRREVMMAFTVGGNFGHGPAIRGSWPAIRGSWPAIRGSWPAIRGSWPFARGASAPLVSPGGQMIFFTADPAELREGELYMVQSIATLPDLPADKKAIGQAYRLAASPAVTQVLPASVSFLYLSVDVLTEGADENELNIHFWNGDAWETLPSVRDPYHNQVTAASQGPGSTRCWPG